MKSEAGSTPIESVHRESIREAIMEVSPTFLAHLFCLPDGVQITNAKYEVDRRVLRLLLSGKQFEPVPEGQGIPTIMPMYLTTECPHACELGPHRQVTLASL